MEHDDSGKRTRALHQAIAVDAVDAVDVVDAIDVADDSRALNTAVEAPESSLPAPGTRIGQYEVIRELGRGGMGAVYAARDTRLGRKVAIKFLKSSNQPELTARFIVEARATARCSHENIVVIHEVGEHAGDPFMVLEYLQGAPLTRLLRNGRKLPPAQAIELMVPVVRALTVAHAHNIVHRDLKPDNIFVTDAGPGQTAMAAAPIVAARRAAATELSMSESNAIPAASRPAATSIARSPGAEMASST